MKKKNLIITIISCIVALAILVGTILIVKKPFSPKYEGSITVEVIALDGTEMKKKDIKFKKNDTLQALIEANFDDVLFETGAYGPFLKNIEGYETPDDYSSYISLYVNNEYSMVGIGLVKFENGTVISLRIETYTG